MYEMDLQYWSWSRPKFHKQIKSTVCLKFMYLIKLIHGEHKFGHIILLKTTQWAKDCLCEIVASTSIVAPLQ